uniref:Uncharacterized protein n=1 Tax=Kalanchoe fedtschenkoi TaxID=63787 RepID=A0A7N0UMW6_KALFE
MSFIYFHKRFIIIHFGSSWQWVWFHKNNNIQILETCLYIRITFLKTINLLFKSKCTLLCAKSPS